MVSSHGTGFESSASKDDSTLMDITQSSSGFSLKGQFPHKKNDEKTIIFVCSYFRGTDLAFCGVFGGLFLSTISEKR